MRWYIVDKLEYTSIGAIGKLLSFDNNFCFYKSQKVSIIEETRDKQRKIKKYA